MLYLETRRLSLDHPVWSYAPLFQTDGYGWLLDSGMDPQRLGRHSFLGGGPAALLVAHRLAGAGPEGSPFRLELTTWRRPDGSRPAETGPDAWIGDPFEALRGLQADYGGPAEAVPADAPPFSGGLVGYFGYETGYAIETLPDTGADDLGLPTVAVMVADDVLCHDHLTGETTLLVTGRGPDTGAARQDAQDRSDLWQNKLSEYSPIDQPPVPDQVPPAVARAHFDRAGYMGAVQACREHILNGDVFEVCLTHRLETDLPGDPWDLYADLRRINPAPFAAWLCFPEHQILSASPERFLRLDSDRVAESRPIKGTRPRGDTPARDAALRRDLAESEKDRAENLMIVDLVRNDLGRVAEIGSVEVTELLAVEPYATVFQLVSTVIGRLKPECDALDLVRAGFPGGSMTGAPKIEAMKIIDSLEPVKRGVYSGAIGYLDRAGGLDLSIVIRTLVCRDGRCTLGVGGAVTADSDPAAEYQETLDKARALLEAVGLAAAREGGRS